MELISAPFSDVTDAGLAHLGRLKSLESLSLPTPITDAGLAHLAGLTNLTTLELNGSKLDGSGLKSLRGLVHLRDLRVLLRGGPIDGDPLGDLKKAIPSLKVNGY